MLNVFNSIEPSIQFTLEKAKNNTLNFLELEIKRINSGNLIINWFEKPTWSGCYLNHESHHLFCQKIGLIKGLVDRCLKLSDIKYRKENLDQIKNILQLNNYPLVLIESVIKERIYEIYNIFLKDEKRKKWLEIYKKTDFKVTLPHIQGLSQRLRRDLKKF